MRDILASQKRMFISAKVGRGKVRRRHDGTTWTSLDASKAIKSKGLTKLSKDFFFQANHHYRLVHRGHTHRWLARSSIIQSRTDLFHPTNRERDRGALGTREILATSRPSGKPLIEPQDQASGSIE